MIEYCLRDGAENRSDGKHIEKLVPLILSNSMF